jgi:hypothetical protein
VEERSRKLDLPKGMIEEFLSPPVSPDCCIFGQTTCPLSARFQDARRTLPVWRRPRLLAMRLHRFDGQRAYAVSTSGTETAPAAALTVHRITKVTM